MLRYHQRTLLILVLVIILATVPGCTTDRGTGSIAPSVQSPEITAAIPVISATPSFQPATEGIPSLPVQEIQITLTAQNSAFSQKTITVPPGAQINLTFINQDTGMPHNFALYTDRSAATKIFIGDIVIGTGTVAYKFRAPEVPGTYFFRCDLHPAQMTGSFIVT